MKCTCYCCHHTPAKTVYEGRKVNKCGVVTLLKDYSENPDIEEGAINSKENDL
jgi:hypothetical protein